MKRWGGRKASRLVALTLATKGDTCVLCHHRGADSADHTIPRAHGGTDTLDNLEPVHHQPCPTCGRRCNQERGTRPRPPRRPAEHHPLSFFSADPV